MIAHLTTPEEGVVFEIEFFVSEIPINVFNPMTQSEQRIESIDIELVHMETKHFTKNITSLFKGVFPDEFYDACKYELENA